MAAMQPANETPTTPATLGANTWVQLGPVAIPGGQSNGQARVNVSGRITAIQIDQEDSNVIYIGTARGGVWKTTDGGRTWHPKTDYTESLAIGALALAPSDHSTLYAGTGEGNVNYLNTNQPFSSIRESYYGSGVLVSTNFGEYWTLRGKAEFTSAAFYRIAVHPLDSKYVWAATTNGLFRTANGGNTWDAITQGLPPISDAVIAATDVVVDPATPTCVYVAFYGDGVYRSSNADDAVPGWIRLPFDTTMAGTPTRIALAISPSSPDIVYALAGISIQIQALSPGLVPDPIGDAALYVVQQRSQGLAQVQALGLGQGFDTYCLGVSVDPTTPEIVYLSGQTLLRAVIDLSSVQGWATDIGQSVHADHHALSFDPSDHMTIHAGTDGGIFKSADAGQTWADWLNSGMCITQFEFIDQHPSTDALVLGGTQDNGTEQFRNSSVFYHSDDGDGGCVAIDPQYPYNMIHTYYSASPTRSEFAGSFGSWNSVSRGLLPDPSLFYPPFALNPTNSRHIVLGTNRLYFDEAHGTRGWPSPVDLPGLGGGLVSALLYISDDVIFAGTTQGQVFRLTVLNGQWTATALRTATLPGNWIWEIATLPNDPNTVFLAMAGYKAPHVWLGKVTVDAVGNFNAAWSDISGKPGQRLPDIPVNTLVVDPKNTKTIYIGTEVGAFRTQDWTESDGGSWEPFSDGLPNTAVYDLKLHSATRLLRAATHGRGLWERQLDVVSAPDTSIYLRAHRMDTGRGQIAITSTQSPFDDSWNDVSLGDELWPWETPDLKVDVLQGGIPNYQLSFVDDVAFESALTHNSPVRGRVNRLYVQVHNRGKTIARNVTIRVYYTEAGPHLPPLSPNFWTHFPTLQPPAPGTWRSFGDAQNLDVLATEPTVVRLDRVMGDGDPDDYCFLIIADGEKIPAENRIEDVQDLIHRERRAALKNVFLSQADGSPYFNYITLNANSGKKEQIEVRSLSSPACVVGALFPKTLVASIKTEGFRPSRPPEFQWLQFRLGDDDLNIYEPSAMQIVGDLRTATIHLPPSDESFRMILALIPSVRWASGRITLLRKIDGLSIGGSTLIIRPVS